MVKNFPKNIAQFWKLVLGCGNKWENRVIKHERVLL